ncbi:MAG: DNA polymerase domain-containing protein [Leptospirillia bacterium]
MSPPPEFRGWLFDILLSGGEILLWILTETGERRALVAPFRPRFYLGAPESEIPLLLDKIARMSLPCTLATTERRTLWESAPQSVIEVTASRAGTFSTVFTRISRSFPEAEFFNVDIDLPRLFLYETGLFPLALCRVRAGEDQRIEEIRAEDSPADTQWTLPPLKVMELTLEETPASSSAILSGPLHVTVDGEGRSLAGDDPFDLVETIDSLLRREDPDLLLTDHGDDILLPRLARLMARTGRSLPLNRPDPMAMGRLSGRQGRSFVSYGQTHFSAGAWTLSGRWHIDRTNSFAYAEAGLEGLLEQARMTRIPVQRLARSSTGTGITSMQIDRAINEGLLVPWRKSEPEDFRSALDLLEGDKGGLVFIPRPGFYESVCELDFASMYPAIMKTFNISPETVDCPCCPDNQVPGTNHTLCRRREGLIPRVLTPLLEKRARYKELKEHASTPEERRRHDQRQGALKWLLVVSFGYLGYKNARFGKVAAHECVTALGREVLLEAKEIAEEEGYSLLHGIVDSLWLSRKDLTEEGCRLLAEKISTRTGIPINLEGIYRWLRFFSSKSRPGVAVSTVYAGAFWSGKIKVRGLACRRSDTPPFIRKVQEDLLALLSRAQNLKEYRRLIPEASRLLDEGLRALRDREIPLSNLVVTKRLSRAPQDYRKASLTAIVAQERLARGIPTDAGQKIRYIITGLSDPDPSSRARAFETFSPDHSWDHEAYADLLRQACAPLLEPPS